MSGFLSQLKNLFLNLSPARRITLLTLVAGTIIGFIFLLTWTGRPDFQILYSNVASEDAGIILSRLKELKIPYRVDNNGDAIMIPREMIHETRMQLASQGLPQGSGVGFEIFDNSKLGMTEFAQNVNYQRALQGELSRTINRFDEVESSRVHIVMASDSLFLEDKKPATASVVLKLKPGKRLRPDQIQGIVHLFSSSVAGLSSENVTVVDSFGRMLAGFNDKDNLGQATSDQLAFQEKMERSLESRVTTMLETALGPHKTIVRLNCELDFKKQEHTEERYLADNRVVRSEQLQSESSASQDTVPMGIPNASSTRVPLSAGGPGDAENQSFQKEDRTVNYEIGKVVSRTVEPVGQVKRISVAVLVDGTYQQDQEATEEEPGLTYIPRSVEEMAKLESIVKRAVNYDQERGDQVEIVNIAFERVVSAEDPSAGSGSGWMSKILSLGPLLKYGLAAVFILLAFIFVVRPLVQWLTSGNLVTGELLKQLPKTVSEIEREYGGAQGVASLAFKDQITQLLSNDSEGSVALMRDWMKE